MKRGSIRQRVAATAVFIIISCFAFSAGADQALTRAEKTAKAQSSATLPADITIAEAAIMRAKGAFILDVREISEWEQFHIPGSNLIPLGQLAGRIEAVPRDRDVVVVCRTGNRSRTGRDILIKAGFTRVTNMAGGVTGWKEEGLPIVTGR